MSLEPPTESFDFLVRAALEEDLRTGDVTTDALVPESTKGLARFRFKEEGVLAGLSVAEAVLRELDQNITFSPLKADGQVVRAGGVVAEAAGPLRALLSGERTALNFLQRLSGIASLTRRFVEEIEGTGAAILDTRKTLPGWRALEKYAVATGGGRNHRFGLFDQVLIKDNHLEVVRAGCGCSLPDAVGTSVRKAREQWPELRIEVEVEDEDCFQSAVQAGADIIMLDNRPPGQMAEWVRWLDEIKPRGDRARPILEASGGIKLANVRAVAETGVDWISLGVLTHSAPALDISMEVEFLGP